MGALGDISGVIQGVGSLAAVGAAVWIYSRQYSDKKADAVAETRAFVQAICDEVQMAWDGYNLEIHPRLKALPAGEPFDFTYPVTVEPFPVFIGNVGMVGKVDDAELRRSIVRAYALARGLLDSFRLNNASVAEYKRLKTMNGPPETNLFTRTHRDRMVEYAGKLKERDEWVEQAVKDLLSRAEQWLNVHPPR
jgi:hypothetical protein